MGYRKGAYLLVLLRQVGQCGFGERCVGKASSKHEQQSRSPNRAYGGERDAAAAMRVRQVPNANVTAGLAMRTAACGTRRDRQT